MSANGGAGDRRRRRERRRDGSGRKEGCTRRKGGRGGTSVVFNGRVGATAAEEGLNGLVVEGICSDEEGGATPHV